MFKFIHAADIHLDSPLRGLAPYEGAPVEEIRQATRRALENLVQLAIDEQVAFVIVAGDLYDGDWRDYNTGLFFVRQCMLLREANIPIYLILGNHDAANRMTRSLKLPDNTSLFPHRAAETRFLDDVGVAVHGQSFAQAAVHDDLSDGYPPAEKGLFNIGVLHTSATGREGHEPYAPCTIDGLRLKGYDYWALGHVHTSEVLSDEPHIAFSGNLQGRHIRETGPKGCNLVTIGDDLSAEVEFRPLDVLRWERARTDVTGAANVDEALERVGGKLREVHASSQGRPQAVRVQLHGATPAHGALAADRQRWTNEIRSLAIDASGAQMWVEKIKFETTPARTAAVDRAADGPIGELLELLRELRTQPDQWPELNIDWSDVLKKLPAELKHAAPFDHRDWLAGALEEVEHRLIREFGAEDYT